MLFGIQNTKLKWNEVLFINYGRNCRVNLKNLLIDVSHSDYFEKKLKRVFQRMIYLLQFFLNLLYYF